MKSKVKDTSQKKFEVAILRALLDENSTQTQLQLAKILNVTQSVLAKDSRRRNMDTTRFNWKAGGESKSYQRTPAQKTLMQFFFVLKRHRFWNIYIYICTNPHRKSCEGNFKKIELKCATSSTIFAGHCSLRLSFFLVNKARNREVRILLISKQWEMSWFIIWFQK